MKQIRKTLSMACLVVSLIAGSLPAGQAFAEPVQTDSAEIAEEPATGFDETEETETECLEIEETETVTIETEAALEQETVFSVEESEFEPSAEERIPEPVLPSEESAPDSASPAAIAPENNPPSAGILRVPDGGFLDVQNSDAEYYEAVYWAAENDIIPGTDDGYFGINDLCTRQQFVVYLWKQAGKPAPQKKDNPFTDVSTSDSYYQAVLWAAEQGIVSSGDGSFGVGKPCERAQIAVVFWKLAGCPLPQTTKNPFSDVSKKNEYYNAVLWAAENNMAGGCSGSSFRPQDYCLKQDIAIALYGYSKSDPDTFYLPEMPQPSVQQNLMGVLVSWNPIAGAEDYRIYRKTESGSWQRIGGTLETSYLDRTPEENTTYYYTVRCVSADGRRFKSYYSSPGAKITTANTIIRTDQAPGPERLNVLFAEAEDACRNAQAELEERRQAYELALAELTQAQQEFESAQAAVQEAEAEVQAVQTEVEEAEAAVREAETAVQEAEAAVQEAKAAIQADPDSYTAQQILELEGNLQTSQEALTAAREALQAAQESLQTAREALQTALEAAQTAQTALQAAQEKADAAAEALETAQTELQHTELTLQALGEARDFYIPATGLRFEKASFSLPTGESTKLSLTLEPENACEYDVIWLSSDESIATVDDYGVVTALTCGEVQITAALADGTQATCILRTLYNDVADSSLYYYDAVYWAAEKNITKGYENVYFGPDDPCTREQMVVFLWRLAGQPSPVTQNNPFSDVKKSAYYYKAVLWAVDQGITNGYDNGTFGVGKPCLREHLATFLWRMAGKPLPKTIDNSFSDVKAADYYYNAVLWAAENGITKGYSNGSFGPGNNCLRQHTVTFLYRCSKCDPDTFYLSAMPEVSAEKRMYDVKITWTGVTGAELYRIYRKTASGSWGRIADTTKTQYVDQTAAPKTTYYYTVRCISADGSQFKSGFESPGAKVTTPVVFPHTGDDLRQLLVENANSYVGTKGQSAKHKHIIDVFNQVQPDGAPMYLYSPWCAAFSSAMSIEVFGSTLADKYFPLSYNCGTIIRKAVVMDIWVEKDSYTPKPGDWIIYDWDDGGSGEDITGADHVGIIKGVSGKTITVIEGNMTNSCDTRTISVNGRYIRGYVTPKYDEIMKHL